MSSDNVQTLVIGGLARREVSNFVRICD